MKKLFIFLIGTLLGVGTIARAYSPPDPVIVKEYPCYAVENVAPEMPIVAIHDVLAYQEEVRMIAYLPASDGFVGDPGFYIKEPDPGAERMNWLSHNISYSKNFRQMRLHTVNSGNFLTFVLRL